MYNQLQIRRELLRESPNCTEFRYILSNPAEEPVWLGEFELFSTTALEELGVPGENCRVFRTGRHKNDMPSIATLGCMDDAMLDALGGMTEAGDRAEGARQRLLISDHLTVLGNDGRYCVLAFITGEDQLVATEIALDDAGVFQSLHCKVQFSRYLRPGEALTTETLRIERTADPEESIRRFAAEKARPRPSLQVNPPSVFCTWYYYGLTVTEEDVMTNLRRMEELKLPFDVFQIDEG